MAFKRHVMLYLSIFLIVIIAEPENVWAQFCLSCWPYAKKNNPYFLIDNLPKYFRNELWISFYLQIRSSQTTRHCLFSGSLICVCFGYTLFHTNKETSITGFNHLSRSTKFYVLQLDFSPCWNECLFDQVPVTHPSYAFKS